MGAIRKSWSGVTLSRLWLLVESNLETVHWRILNVVRNLYITEGLIAIHDSLDK